MIWVTWHRWFIWSKLCEALDTEWVDFVRFEWRLENLGDVEKFFSHWVSRVIHLAWRIDKSDIEKSISANVTWSKNLFEVSKRKWVEGIVYTSTRDIYRFSDTPISEKWAIDTRDCYTQTKLQAEKILLESDIPSIVLRPSSVYWGGQWVIDIFRRKIFAWDTITINWDGSDKRDFVHVSDIIQWILLAADNIAQARKWIYNIWSHCILSVNEVAEEIWSRLGIQPIIEHQASVTPGGTIISNIRRAEEELWYSPTHETLYIPESS